MCIVVLLFGPFQNIELFRGGGGVKSINDKS